MKQIYSLEYRKHKGPYKELSRRWLNGPRRIKLAAALYRLGGYEVRTIKEVCQTGHVINNQYGHNTRYML
jgi:hypothetical protein